MVGLTKLTRGKSKEEAMSFLQEKNVTYPVAKESGDLSKHFNVSGIPAAAVVKDGTIVWRTPCSFDRRHAQRLVKITSSHSYRLKRDASVSLLLF